MDDPIPKMRAKIKSDSMKSGHFCSLRKNRTKNQSQEIEKSVKDKSKQKTIFNVLHTTVTY